MNTLMRWTVALVVMSGGAAYAQSVTGTWQARCRTDEICGS